MSAPATSLLSTRNVGDLNRASVLRALIVHGRLSRSELAQRARVTRATMGTIVHGLLDDGLLEELEALDAGRVGKPARPLWFRAGAGTVLTVELRRQVVRGALVDARGTIEHLTESALTDANDAATVQRTVEDVVARLLGHRQAIGVGVSVPGACDPSSGAIFGSVQVPGAVGTHLAAVVAEMTGLDTWIENDTRALAVAEHWFGRGRYIDTFAAVQTGDGLGAGLLLDGVIHRGRNGAAGEIGHTAVVIGGVRCACGKRGCWETVATLRWLRRTARSRGVPGARTLDAAHLVALAAAGDAVAGALVEEYAEHLAIGLANLDQTLGTELIILHGDAVGGGVALRDRIRDATHRRSARPVDVQFTDLVDASLLGAAGVVLSELLHIASPP